MERPLDVSALAELRRRYLELLKRALGDFLYDIERPEAEPDRDEPPFFYTETHSGRRILLTTYQMRKLHGLEGGDRAHSMIGLKRLNQLQAAAETVLQEGIPGDFVETGILRGGACILLRGVLAAYGDTERRVWGADSFRGFPPRVMQPGHAPEARFYSWAAPRSEVEENFRRYGLLDRQVELLEGWFADTLPAAPIERLAILRLDGDLYASTRDALQALYFKLSPGGFAIIDDYHAFAECRQAVTAFRAAHGIDAPLMPVDPLCVYWRRPGQLPRQAGPAGTSVSALRRRYLDLLRNTLGDFLYDRDREALLARPVPPSAAEVSAYDRRKAAGLLRSDIAFSDSGPQRLRQLQTAVEASLAEKIAGDLLEAGIGRGGNCLLMAGVLAAHGVTDRQIWALTPRETATAEAELDEALRRYDLPDARLQLLTGPFAHSLTRLAGTPLAVLRLGADLGEACHELLDRLYATVSPGGWIIIDDYYRAPSRDAVDAFRRQQAIDTPLMNIDGCGAYWRKPGA